MPQAQIQATVDAIAAKQVPDQFGTGRYALLFAARHLRLGRAPVDLPGRLLHGGRRAGRVAVRRADQRVDRRLQPVRPGGCTALVNFWRSLSNLSIHVAGQQGCQTNTEFWAVSQAAPMRRVHVAGTFSLMDYCSAGPQFASGGFIADSAFADSTVNGSQQQFLVRNST